MTHRLKHDLERDFRNSPELMQKIQKEYYAQNLYAAMCNMRWQKIEVIPILKDEYWSASWRGAGGIVADLRNCGEDYIDWYCSGMGGVAFSYDNDEDWMAEKRYVPEGTVTEEIEYDLRQIGWQPSPWPDKED